MQEDAIRIAIENNNNIKFIQGNAEQLPFQDNSIDVIITNNLLIHLDKENLLKTVSEICRVTKKYFWSFEYYNTERKNIIYHEHDNLLWKDDFKRYFEEGLV